MMETKEQKNESRTKEKKPLTEQQRQQRQKMLVYPLMVLLFAGCMWLIFAPSSEDKEKERQGQGFNTDMPMPEDSKIIGDKAKAYEQQDLENKRKERRGMVGDLSAFWNDSDGDTPTDDADTSDDYRLTRTETTDGETAVIVRSIGFGKGEEALEIRHIEKLEIYNKVYHSNLNPQ